MRIQAKTWRAWGATNDGGSLDKGRIRALSQIEIEARAEEEVLLFGGPHVEVASRWGVAMTDVNQGTPYPAGAWPLFPSLCWRQWCEAPVQE